MNAAGYEKDEYWQQEIVHEGKVLRREEAIKFFVDRTGKPSPATWSNARYPDGEEDFPVGGVSWYEAAAYAAFVGKDLPTTHHWQRASVGDTQYFIPLSNFAGRGPARVGSYQGITPRGVYDLAGKHQGMVFQRGG